LRLARGPSALPGNQLVPFRSVGYELIIISPRHYTYIQADRVHIKDSNGPSFVSQKSLPPIPSEMETLLFH
jgi:hypothetical protein